MKSAQRVGELRLCLDQDGVVWYGEPGKASLSSSLAFGPFAQQSWVRDAESIHLLGTQRNAALICELHRLRCTANSSQVIRLGNPQWVPKNYRKADAIFRKMEGMELPASLGGWHRLTEKEYVTYALVGALGRSGGKFNNLVERLFRAHPAQPAISFLSSTDKKSACNLIVAVLDPRWHVKPTSPDGHAGIKAFLGLTKKNVAAILEKEKNSGDRGAGLARLVLHTWTGGDYSPPPQDVVGPRGFLWRLQAKWEGCDFVTSMIRTSACFLRFLQAVWLDNLTEARKYEFAIRKLGFKRKSNVKTSRLVRMKSYSPQLFTPSCFFDNLDEIEAWTVHVECLKKHSA